MKIMFIFDKLLHYHEEFFVNLEFLLNQNGDSLILLSGTVKERDTGRVGLEYKIIKSEIKYKYYEFKLFSFVFRCQRNVLDKIIKLKPDIIVMQSHVGNITLWKIMRMKRKLGFNLYSWQCGYEYNNNFIKRLVLKIFLKKFDYHLAYHTNAKYYVMKYGVSSKKITVIHNTINEKKVNNINKNTAKARLSRRYPQLSGKKIILFVGAILKEKRIESIIRAVNKLNREDVSVVIVGDGLYLKMLVNKSVNRNNLIFVGKCIEGVDLYFMAADIFVLPGTGGLAINHAMSYSLPIISGYADGSADDLVIDGITGFRLINDSINELMNCINLLLDNDELRKKMGDKAHELINEKYSFGNFINRVFNALKFSTE